MATWNVRKFRGKSASGYCKTDRFATDTLRNAKRPHGVYDVFGIISQQIHDSNNTLSGREIAHTHTADLSVPRTAIMFCKRPSDNKAEGLCCPARTRRVFIGIDLRSEFGARTVRTRRDVREDFRRVAVESRPKTAIRATILAERKKKNRVKPSGIRKRKKKTVSVRHGRVVFFRAFLTPPSPIKVSRLRCGARNTNNSKSTWSTGVRLLRSKNVLELYVKLYTANRGRVNLFFLNFYHTRNVLNISNAW